MAGAEAEGRRESEAEAEDEWASEAEGVPLTVTSPNDFPYKWKIVRERVAFVASAAVINIAY